MKKDRLSLACLSLMPLKRLSVRYWNIPKHARFWGDHVRRKFLSRFPYGVIFAAEEDRIRVVAIAHLKRRPEYWAIGFQANSHQPETGDRIFARPEKKMPMIV
jgi:hypothetical protein